MSQLRGKRKALTLGHREKVLHFYGEEMVKFSRCPKVTCHKISQLSTGYTTHSIYTYKNVCTLSYRMTLFFASDRGTMYPKGARGTRPPGGPAPR